MNQPNVYAFARMAAQGDIKAVYSGVQALRRGEWIICRSNFGLELAEVLSDTQSHDDLYCDSDSPTDSIAHWVRSASSQDHWLWNKLQSVNQQAIAACQDFLNQHQCQDTILQIATSIDGKSVAFEFLGQATKETNRELDRLSEIYQSFVRSSDVYQQIEVGCGPGCGTTASCGSSADGKKGCSSCSIASRCKKH